MVAWTPGNVDHGLKAEADLGADIIWALKKRGHDIKTVPAKSEIMGHAGMVKDDVRHGVTAAADPRSDGLALSSRINFCDFTIFTTARMLMGPGPIDADPQSIAGYVGPTYWTGLIRT